MTDQRPLCAEHPDRLSVGTCARCGRFACESCFLPDTGLCTTCGSRIVDPLGVRSTPFSVGRVLESGWKLTRAALPTAIGISVSMVLFSSLWNWLQFSVVDFESLRSPNAIQAVLRASTLLMVLGRSLVLGPFLYGVLLAQMAGAAQGEAVSVLEALRRSAKAYRRMFWAQLVLTLATLIGGVACLLPGVFAAVVFWPILPAAYLEPGQVATETCIQLTRGRRWSVFALLLLSRTVILVTTVVNYAVMFWAVRSGLSGEQLAPLLSVTEPGLDLAQELAESFTVAMTLAAYFSLRHAAGQEL